MTGHRDIVIAGGGMVGISLALQLDSLLPSDISILLVEGVPLPTAGDSQAYHPSFDSRSTALSYSSRLLYEQMGVWSTLQDWLCPIKRIHVSTRGRFGSALLDAADHGWPALGYVAENAWLGQALAEALSCRPRVELRSPARVVAVRKQDRGVHLRIAGDDECELDAALLLVADGANSTLCRLLGVDLVEKPYGQCAVVANVASAQAHGGCAFERFSDDGPLALLPLPAATGGEHRSAVVWTLPPERAAEMVECAAPEFLARLQRAFGYRLGRLQRVGARQSYPLALTLAGEQVREGIVVMGNAAHTLHPVAGQGYNLALRDIAELATVLASAVEQGRTLGDLRTLVRYQRRQGADQARTIGFSDHIPALFMHNDPLLGMGRDIALAGLDILPALKREFVRHAAGVAALGQQRHG